MYISDVVECDKYNFLWNSNNKWHKNNFRDVKRKVRNKFEKRKEYSLSERIYNLADIRNNAKKLPLFFWVQGMKEASTWYLFFEHSFFNIRQEKSSTSSSSSSS